MDYRGITVVSITVQLSNTDALTLPLEPYHASYHLPNKVLLNSNMGREGSNVKSN